MKNLLLACVSSYAILTSINTPVFSTEVVFSSDSEEEDSGVIIQAKVVQEFPNNDNDIIVSSNSNHDDQGELNNLLNTSSSDSNNININQTLSSNEDNELKFITDTRSFAFKGDDDQTNDFDLSDNTPQNQENDESDLSQTITINFPINSDFPEEEMGLSNNEQINDYYSLNGEEDGEEDYSSDLLNNEEGQNIDNNDQDKKIIDSFDFQSSNQKMPLFHDSLISTDPTNYNKKSELANEFLKDTQDLLDLNNNESKADNIDFSSDSYGDLSSSNPDVIKYHQLFGNNITRSQSKDSIESCSSENINQTQNIENNKISFDSGANSGDDHIDNQQDDNLDYSSESLNDDNNDQQNIESNDQDEKINVSKVIDFDNLDDPDYVHGNPPAHVPFVSNFSYFAEDRIDNQQNNDLDYSSESLNDDNNNQENVESNDQDENINQTQNIDNQQDDNLDYSSESLNDDNNDQQNIESNDQDENRNQPQNIDNQQDDNLDYSSNLLNNEEGQNINNQRNNDLENSSESLNDDNNDQENIESNDQDEKINQTQNIENNEISFDENMNSGDDRIDNQQNNDLDYSSDSFDVDNNDQQNIESNDQDENINQTQNIDNNGISFDENMNSGDDRIDNQQNILDIPDLLDPTEEERALLVQIFGQAINRAIITPRLQATINNVPVGHQQEIQGFLNDLFGEAHNQLQQMEEYTQGLKELDNYFEHIVLQNFDGTPSEEEFTRAYFGFIADQNDYLREFTRFLEQQAFEGIFSNIRYQIDGKAQGFIQLMNDDQPEEISVNQLKKQLRKERIKKIQESTKQRREAEKQNEAKGNTQPAKKTSSTSTKSVKKVEEKKPEVVEVKTEAPRKKSSFKVMNWPKNLRSRVKERKNEVVENTPIKLENKPEVVEVKTEAPKKKSSFKVMNWPKNLRSRVKERKNEVVENTPIKLENKPEVVEVKTEAPKKKSSFKVMNWPKNLRSKVKERKNDITENNTKGKN